MIGQRCETMPRIVSIIFYALLAAYVLFAHGCHTHSSADLLLK